MIPTKDEHKIFSEYLYNQVDWKRIYEDTAPVSKKNFTKESILGHVEKLILEYSSHYDTSCIEGRVESSTSTLAVKVGLINNYYYIISQPMTKFNGEYLSWFMTEEAFLEYIDIHKKSNRYCIVVNIKNCLRNHKLQKICQTITQTTNSVQK
jgi:3-hydroxy-3-methylglutaryl CoA synthase